MNDILQLIDHNVRSKPMNIAIEQGNIEVNYSELGNTVERYVSALMELAADDKVYAIMMTRSPELISTILAVMKLGGIFVLIDPDYPVNRIQGVMNQIESTTIITNSACNENVKEVLLSSGIRKDIFVIDHCDTETRSLELPKIDKAAYENCYRYYTSGSTGAPKGVIGSYEGLNHFINWQLNEFQIGSDCRVAQLTSPAFDPFLRDVFVPLCSGGTLVIPETSKLIFNPRELLQWLNNRAITLMHIVPSMFRLLVESEEQPALQSMKLILLAGEMVKGRDLAKFYSIHGENISLINLYGPTETTLAKFYYRISKDDIAKNNVPVGIPIAGTSYFVVDENNEECGTGQEGEVYIKPPFKMGGYINPDDSINKFVHFKTIGTVFRTGDLGMIMPDGNLQLLGRMDKEIKINGIRIDTSEIEAEILSQTIDCQDVVVEAIENRLGIKYLCAFIQSSNEIPSGPLRDYLKSKLPDYMVPVQYYVFDQFEYLPNGKINRMQLVNYAQQDLESVEITDAANSSGENQDIYRELTRIWSQLLFKDSFQLNDNFFNMGGHSLTAINLIAEVYKQFKVEIPIDYVFDNPTFEQIMSYINQAITELRPELAPTSKQAYFELSSAQKRMYILNLFEDVGLTYNSPLLLKVDPNSLDVPRLELAIQNIVDRHEILRTSFYLENGVPVQKVHDQVNVKISEFEITDIDSELKLQMHPFELSSAPLFKVKILRTQTDTYLFVDFHHIIIDGTSKKLFVQELNACYAGRQLSSPAKQYRDFLAWQNQLFASEEMNKQKEYWLNMHQGSKFNKPLTTDFPKQAASSFVGDRYFFRVDETLLSKLKGIEAQSQVTLFMILFAAYNVFMFRLTRDEEISVGMPIDNRRLHEFQQTIGLITNTLVIKSKIDSGSTYREALALTKQNIILALKNQDYPFEMLVNDLKIKRDLASNPIFNTMFAHQHVHLDITSDLIVANCNVNYQHSRFDFLLQAFIGDNSLELCFEYRSDLYKESTIETFGRQYMDILNRFCDLDSEIDIVMEEECEHAIQK